MAVAEQSPARRRSHARLGLRLLVSAGLFAVLITKIHFDDREHAAGALSRRGR